MWIPSPDFPTAPIQVSPTAARLAISANIAACPQAHRRTADSRRVVHRELQNWRGFLNRRAKAAGMTADSLRDASSAFGHAMGAPRLIGDSASYYSQDLQAEYGQPIARPMVPSTLLGAVPVKTVDVSKAAVRLRFVDTSASVEVRTPGKTTLPLATAERTEGLREMFVFHTGYAGQDWRGRQLQSGVDYNDDADKATACEQALNRFLSYDWLRGGAAGLDSYHFGNLPVLSQTGSLTYGTSDVDDVLEDFTAQLQLLKEIAKGAMGTGALKLMISPRILNRLSSYSNFGSGGGGRSKAALLDIIASEGYQVQEVHELQDFGGDHIDAMIAYIDGPDGLKHLLSMRPGPADTYQSGGVTITEMATISGGLVCPNTESCYIYKTAVSANPT